MDGGDHDDHGHGQHDHDKHGDDEHDHDEHGSDADTVHLSEVQIAAAGITLAVVREGMAGALTVPATIAVDPQTSAVVAAAVGGRITSLERQLGESVRTGDTLAVIESREAAELQAEIAIARQQRAMANMTLEREERLFREKVSAEQDVLQARAAAADAGVRLQLAEQRLGASGARGDALNRIVVRAPASGHVVAREVVLGQVVQADAELFRVADLSTLSLELALPPDAAASVAVGNAVTVGAGTRTAEGHIVFVSPVIDPHSRQVRAVASLPNRAGQWRVGEAVQASVAVATRDGMPALAVPKTALQMVEDQPSVFVRSDEGFIVKHLKIGAANGDHVTVLSGLVGGERIAVTNSYVLKAELGKGEGGHDHAH